MSIEIGSKWVKDGEVVEVLSNPFNCFYPYEDSMNMKEREKCVWFINNEGNHVLTERDFLEQYKPFQPVYEYQFLWKVKDGDCWDSVTSYHKDIQECINSECEEERGRYEYQRLDFTKRERKQ